MFGSVLPQMYVCRTHRRVLVLGQHSRDDRSFLCVRRHHALVEVLAEHGGEVVHVLEAEKREPTKASLQLHWERLLPGLTLLQPVCRCCLLAERINLAAEHIMKLCLISANTQQVIVGSGFFFFYRCNDSPWPRLLSEAIIPTQTYNHLDCKYKNENLNKQIIVRSYQTWKKCVTKLPRVFFLS